MNLESLRDMCDSDPAVPAGQLPSRADVVIVGGGIIGLSIAYHAVKSGMRDVLVLETGSIGQGSTGKCAGGIRTQFSTRINIEFSLLSFKTFQDFSRQFGVDPGFRPVGYLFLATRKEQWETLQRSARLQVELGVEVELLSPEEIQRCWPLLRVNDLEGGSFTARDGYAGPHEVLQGFARGARRLGASIREGVEVTGIRVKRGRVEGVETSRGESVVAGTVVNAAGPYAARVGAMAGLDIPVRPLRRQVFFTDSVDASFTRFPMVIDLDHGWYMRPEGKGLLLAGRQDSVSSFNENTDHEGREWAATRAVYRVPGLESARIAGGWAGLYEISPDHHALIGAFPHLKGFVCANGFSGHGFQHSPAVGVVVAELLREGRAHSLDIHPLRPERFSQGDLIREPLTAFKD
ncbi:NAD(P)/FAD-dependent oxidoreductase [Thermodesulfobacteriota bacterium]